MPGLVLTICQSLQTTIRSACNSWAMWLPIPLWHMARLHSQCLQGCLRTIYFPNKQYTQTGVHISEGPWFSKWVERSIKAVCGNSVLAAITTDPLTDRTRHVLSGLHSSGQKDVSEGVVVHEHSRSQSSLCLTALPTPHQGPSSQNNTGQQRSIVLYQLTRSKIPVLLHRIHKTMELVHITC